MIRYNLKCAKGHAFDSWFASSEAFDRLKSGGQIKCTTCGCSEVEKSLMAPQRTGAAEPSLSTPETKLEAALQALRHEIETHSEDVGNAFATEARAIHEGDAPERPIHGQARLDEARALVEDGVSILPLPFTPRDKTN